MQPKTKTMKKTLISLISLSGMAFGASYSTIDTTDFLVLDSQLASTTMSFSNGGTHNAITNGNDTLKFSLKGETSLTNYIYTFKFSNVKNVNHSGFIELSGTDNLCVRGTKDSTSSQKNTIYVVGQTNSTDKKTSGSLIANNDDIFALTISKENNVGYLSNITTHEYVTIDDLTEAFGVFSEESSEYVLSDSAIAITNGTTRIWSHGGDVQQCVLQLADLSGLTAAQVLNVAKTGNIPEPATATLSLLALAGLAARRRRH